MPENARRLVRSPRFFLLRLLRIPSLEKVLPSGTVGPRRMHFREIQARVSRASFRKFRFDRTSSPRKRYIALSKMNKLWETKCVHSEVFIV